MTILPMESPRESSEKEQNQAFQKIDEFLN